MELIYQVKCLNRYCDNAVAEHRIKKQSPNVSKWDFCIHCMKWNNQPIEYYCRKKGCDNIIIKDGTPSAFCSILCCSRHNYNTRENEMRQCKTCDKMYESNLGYYQIYCGKYCRDVGNKKITGFKSSQTLIVELLKRGDQNLETLSIYTKKSFNTVRQSICQLRLKGHHINKIDKGLYHYVGLIK